MVIFPADKIVRCSSTHTAALHKTESLDELWKEIGLVILDQKGMARDLDHTLTM